jgi:hypothetical protein
MKREDEFLKVKRSCSKIKDKVIEGGLEKWNDRPN